jgi:hypothetical protein
MIGSPRPAVIPIVPSPGWSQPQAQIVADESEGPIRVGGPVPLHRLRHYIQCHLCRYIQRSGCRAPLGAWHFWEGPSRRTVAGPRPNVGLAIQGSLRYTDGVAD